MTTQESQAGLRILYISPLFVPLANPEAYCGARMAMALMGQGVELEVLQDLRDLSRPSAQRDTSTMWTSLDAVRRDTGAPDTSLLRAVWHALRYRVYSRWAHSAVATARRLHAEKPFDLVYSRSLPIQGHVVGSWCSRILGIPWVVNINDPWDKRTNPISRDNPRTPLWATINSYWLKRTLREAALVTFPSSTTSERTITSGGVACHVEILPHVGSGVPSEPDEGRFRIVYAGLLGLEAYQLSAEGLFGGVRRFLAERPDAKEITRLTFIGPEASETQAMVKAMGLQHVVENTGRVPYEEALRWIGRANVCLLVETPLAGGVPLPSKLAHYITARKPVLTLSPPDGTIADMCPDPGLVRVDPADSKGIAQALVSLYDDFRAGTLDRRRPSEDLVRLFEAEQVAGQFLSALDRVGIAKRP